MRLQTKVIYAVLPLVIAPLLLLGWLAFLKMQDAIVTSKQQEMKVRLQQIEMRFASLINTASANIELFSGSRLLHDYVLLESEEDRYELLQPALLNLFASYQHAYPEYEEIRVIYPDGYEDTRFARLGLDNKTEYETESLIYKLLIQSSDSVVWTIDKNVDTEQQAVYIGKKIIITDPSIETSTAPPELRAYLVLTVSLASLQELLVNTVLGETGMIFATDQDGVVLFRNKATIHDHMLGRDLFAVLNKRAMRGQSAELISNGTIVHYSGVKLHERFRIFAALPEAELLVDTRNLGAVVAMITLVAIALTVTLVLLFIRKLIIAPLQKLSLAAAEIGKGNLDLSLNIDARDEIGDLAHSFKVMGNNLAATNDRIKFMAYHDELTGLPNRRMFQEHLVHALAVAKRNHSKLALLFLDVDNFKNVNDTLGHHAGDELLVELSGRFSSVLRDSDYLSHVSPRKEYLTDTVSRLGGDEFTFILTDLNQEYAESKVARRLLDVLSEPMIIAGQKLVMTGSIGITLYPDDASNAETLTRNADIAMYHAKENGKNNYQYFTESINKTVQERLRIDNRLQQALERNEFSLVYQPLVNAKTGEINGCEALMRWNNSELGMVPPSTFIPMAEENGLIVTMGKWALDTVCKQIRAWQHKDIQAVPVSVNVSAIQLRHGELAETIRNLLVRTEIDPAMLILELTESALLEAVDHSINTLAEIKSLGVRISLDDFGTGYSSLSYLRKFQIDILKIDRSFVRDIESKKDDAELSRAIIAMAHSLDLPVTVEGVETEGQRDILVKNGVDTLQGYFFYYPLSVDEVTRKLRQKHKQITRLGLI